MGPDVDSCRISFLRSRISHLLLPLLYKANSIAIISARTAIPAVERKNISFFLLKI